MRTSSIATVLVPFNPARLKFAIAALALSAGSAIGSPVTAIAWDTLSGAQLNTASVPIVTPSVWAALEFTAGASGDVVSVTAPLSIRSGAVKDTVISFTFFTDGGSTPGNALGNSVLQSLTTSDTAPQNFSLTGWSGATLQQGASYWLVASWSSGDADGARWWGATHADGAAYRSSNNGATWEGGAGIVPMLLSQIEVGSASSQPVPEPAGTVLVAAALAALAWTRRRAS